MDDCEVVSLTTRLASAAEVRRLQVWRRGVRAVQGPSPHPRTDSAGSPRTSGAAAGGLAARADVTARKTIVLY